eukprot:scaffold137_cov398-Prasinococcus_capsulatus_cf.AAC.6
MIHLAASPVARGGGRGGAKACNSGIPRAPPPGSRRGERPDLRARRRCEAGPRACGSCGSCGAGSIVIGARTGVLSGGGRARGGA